MKIGLDIGYSSVKAVSGNRRTNFPSVVGSPETSIFSLEDDKRRISLYHPQEVLIGHSAALQSRHLHRREDRAWIEGDEWYLLFLSAISELTSATLVNTSIVTGLPVSFYSDRAKVRERLIGEHYVQREGRSRQRIVINSCRVIPQPYGTLLSETLDDRGRVSDMSLAEGTVGIIDVGGKTTNLLSVSRLTTLNRRTAGVSLGAWDAVRAAREKLSTAFPDLELRDFEIQNVLASRKLTYYGTEYQITELVADVLSPIVGEVYGVSSQLWNAGADLSAILFTGGGAILLGKLILDAFFYNARIVDEPVYANAVGFWKLAQRVF